MRARDSGSVNASYTTPSFSFGRGNGFKHFESKNIDTIIDDMDENLSSKIKKFNLIGVPYQIILGKNSQDNLLEFKEIGKDPKSLTLDQITQILTEQKLKN